MSTLTDFIYQEENSKNIERYEVIENERVTDRIISNQNISGVLFSISTFKNVTFKNCEIFGSRFENVEFLNCRFIDCNLQFSTIIYCDFHKTTFKGCNWNVSPVSKSLFSNCTIDDKSLYFLRKEPNRFMDETLSGDLTQTITMDKIAA